MKALIIMTVFAMATSAIAVPLSRQAKAQALLAAIQDNAEMEGLLSYIGNAIAKHGPGLLKKGIKAAGDAGIWNEELDRESAVVQEEAEMDNAEMEGLLSYIGNAIAKHGPGLLKKGIKAAGDAGIWNEELDRESVVVQEEAEMDNAEMEGLLSYIIAKHGPGLLKKGIKAAGDAGIWNEELDRESAVVQEEAEMDNAEMEGLLSYIGNAIAKHGPGLLKKGIKAAGDAGIWNEELDRESAVVQEEAEMDNAEMEGLLSFIGNAIAKHGPGLLKKGIKAAGDAGIWNEELDRESAVVQEEAEMDDAEMEGLLLDEGNVRVQGPRSKSAPSHIVKEPDQGFQTQMLPRMKKGGVLKPYLFGKRVLPRMKNGGALKPYLGNRNILPKWMKEALDV
ncbi:uncharacterized protein LOC135351740 [Halichondria panicea]|uniref:uncharacterized protein LOC135351740 n=1 Tax=Halichondria panicea TaxID=6063 RepID=UPI00312B6496